MPTLQTYPFDPTGQAPANLIVGEQHAVQEANYRDYYYIVPTYAPFFASDVSISLTATDGSTRQLMEGEDYYFAIPFIGATRSIGTPLYGAISFNNAILSGSISLRYHTLGGDFTTDPNAILQNLALLAYNPRTALWDIVTNKPAVFPPINHPQDIDTIFGAEAVINAIITLANTIANASGTTIVIGNSVGGGGSGDTYAVSPDRDIVLNGDTLTVEIIGHGASVPDTLYWSTIFWNATPANMASNNGSIAMTLNGGVKRGTLTIPCTNTSAVPVAFNLALRDDNVGGDILAMSDLIWITKGDMVVAKTGQIVNNNQTKSGFVFSEEKNTGLSNPASRVLDVIINDATIVRFDEVSHTRTIFFGPNNTYRMIWLPDGDIQVLDDQNTILFSLNDVASQTYVQNLIANFATTTYVNAAIAAIAIPKNKLFYLLNT